MKWILKKKLLDITQFTCSEITMTAEMEDESEFTKNEVLNNYFYFE